MDNENHYAWEKLHNAVLILCGEGTKQEKLNLLATELVQITPENDLPEEVRGAYKNLMDELPEVASEKIDDCIENVISLYGKICCYGKRV